MQWCLAFWTVVSRTQAAARPGTRATSDTRPRKKESVEDHRRPERTVHRRGEVRDRGSSAEEDPPTKRFKRRSTLLWSGT